MEAIEMDKEEFVNEQQEAAFNAGLEIAKHLHSLFCAASEARLNGDENRLLRFLNIAEIKMAAEFRENKKAKEEIDLIKTKYSKTLEIYNRVCKIGRPISHKIRNEVFVYATEYESALLFWRNKFGLGMPTKDGKTSAAYR